MKSETVQKLLQVVGLLKGEGLLDGTGGAVSARAGDELLVTRGGSARMFWKLSEEDILVTSSAGSVKVRKHKSDRAPLGMAMHVLVYQLWPEASVVIHSHAGFAYVASCLGIGLTGEAPVRSLGNIPCLVSDQNPAEFSRNQWDENILRPALMKLISADLPGMPGSSLAFLEFEHGFYVISTDLNLAVTDVARMHRAAEVALSGVARGAR